MKKTLTALLAIGCLAAQGDVLDLTWVGAENGKWDSTANWVVTGTENHPDSIPGYTNTTEAVYRINDGAVVSAQGVSIGNMNGKLIVGDNVTFGGNWAVIFKDVEIGKNFTWGYNSGGTLKTDGDGLKFITGNGYTVSLESTANHLVINSTYTGNNIISTLGTGSSIDFCTEGKIVMTGNTPGSQNCAGLYDANTPRPLTLSAQVDTIESETGTMHDRMLIQASDLWFRDKDGVYRDDVFSLTMTSLDGSAMVKYDSVMNKDAVWTINGQVVAIEDLAAGAYRSYATANGIGVQYYTTTTPTPEPTTGTLSLLALAGLYARRRRK